MFNRVEKAIHKITVNAKQTMHSCVLSKPGSDKVSSCKKNINLTQNILKQNILFISYHKDCDYETSFLHNSMSKQNPLNKVLLIVLRRSLSYFHKAFPK